MTAKNDITGDALITKNSNDAYRDGWERIFGQKEVLTPPKPQKEDTSKVDADRRAADALRTLWWEYCRTSPKGVSVLPFQKWHDQVYLTRSDSL